MDMDTQQDNTIDITNTNANENTVSIDNEQDDAVLVSVSRRCMGFNNSSHSQCTFMCTVKIPLYDVDRPLPFAYCGHHHPVRKQERKREKELKRKREREALVQVATCTICHEDILVIEEHIKTKPCGHLFHSACINKWLCRETTCPNCRETVETVKYIMGK